MKTNEKLANQLSRMGFSWDWIDEAMPTLLTLRRLANKHHRLAEMSCNGEGWISGKFYSMGGADYSKLIEKHNAYIKDDYSIFDQESDKVEAKIKALCNKVGLRVEFQGDPRGYTCKFYAVDGQFIDVQG